MDKVTGVQWVLIGGTEDRNTFEDLGVDGNIILK
jgi:hypothetical protein